MLVVSAACEATLVMQAGVQSNVGLQNKAECHQSNKKALRQLCDFLSCINPALYQAWLCSTGVLILVSTTSVSAAISFFFLVRPVLSYRCETAA